MAKKLTFLIFTLKKKIGLSFYFTSDHTKDNVEITETRVISQQKLLYKMSVRIEYI